MAPTAKGRPSRAEAQPAVGRARAGGSVQGAAVGPAPAADDAAEPVARVLPAPGTPMSESALSRAKQAAAAAPRRAQAGKTRGQADPSAPAPGARGKPRR